VSARMRYSIFAERITELELTFLNRAEDILQKHVTAARGSFVISDDQVAALVPFVARQVSSGEAGRASDDIIELLAILLLSASTNHGSFGTNEGREYVIRIGALYASIILSIRNSQPVDNIEWTGLGE
jgi:hypothetical protein